MIRPHFLAAMALAFPIATTAQEVALKGSRVLSGYDIVAWHDDAAILRNGEQWLRIARAAIATYTPKSGGMSEGQLADFKGKYRGLPDRKHAIATIKGLIAQVGSGPAREEILSDYASLLIAEGRWIDALRALEEHPNPTLLARLAEAVVAHSRSLAPVVTKDVDEAAARRAVARERCGLARIPGTALDRDALAREAACPPEYTDTIGDLALCGACSGRGADEVRCGLCSGRGTVTVQREIMIMGIGGGRKVVTETHKCGPCDGSGRVRQTCGTCNGACISTSGVPSAIADQVASLARSLRHADAGSASSTFRNLASIARARTHTLRGTIPIQIFSYANKLADEFATAWDARGESGSPLLLIRAGLELNTFFDRISPPLPLQTHKRWPESTFSPKSALLLTQDEMCADPTTIPNRWLVTLARITGTESLKGLTTWVGYRTGLPFRAGGWAGAPDLPWLDALAGNDAEGRTLKAWLKSYPFDDMARRAAAVKPDGWYALYGRIQINPPGIPASFEVWRVDPIEAVDAGVPPAADPPKVETPPVEPPPPTETPPAVGSETAPSTPVSLTGSVGARVKQADQWFAEGLAAVGTDSDAARRSLTMAKQAYEGAAGLANGNRYIRDQIAEAALHLGKLGATSNDSAPGADGRFPYPAAESQAKAFRALEADLLALKDQGSEAQAWVREAIEGRGKVCAPVLLNVLQRLDQRDEAEIVLSSFVCGMLAQLFQLDNPPDFDPATEGDAGFRARRATVQRWVTMFREGKLK